MSFQKRLASKEFAVLAEMHTPKGINISRLVNDARRLKGRVDAVVVPDMDNGTHADLQGTLDSFLQKEILLKPSRGQIIQLPQFGHGLANNLNLPQYNAIHFHTCIQPRGARSVNKEETAKG